MPTFGYLLNWFKILSFLSSLFQCRPSSSLSRRPSQLPSNIFRSPRESWSGQFQMDGLGFGHQLKPPVPHRVPLYPASISSLSPASKCEKWFDFNGRHWVISLLRSSSGYHPPTLAEEVLRFCDQLAGSEKKKITVASTIFPFLVLRRGSGAEQVALGEWLIPWICIRIRTRSCGGGTWESGLKNCNLPRKEVCPWTIFRTTNCCLYDAV